jgi:hypothetical protein
MLTGKRSFLFFITIILAVSCGNASRENENVSAVSESGAGTEASAKAQDGQSTPAVEILLPSVVLRDEARVWDNDGGELSDSSLASLDMGTIVTYLGIDEELKSGKNSYQYSRIRLDDGTEGWLSTVRLAKDSVPAVIVEESYLYSKPYRSSPLKRRIPAGQIVAVSREKGRINDFAEVRFSYYDKGAISVPESGYVKYDVLSSFSGDLDVAKLVLKAFRNPDLKDDFLKLAFTQNTAFVTDSSPGKRVLCYDAPDMAGEFLELEGPVEILAVNPMEEGEALPWYIAMKGTGDLAWVSADRMGNSVKLSAGPKEHIIDKPEIPASQAYQGGGEPSVCLYQGLSLRRASKDDKGNDILQAFTYLDMGEIVYAQDGEKDYEGTDYVNLDLPEKSSGWSSRSYIAEGARPAVMISDGVPVFDEAKLTGLTKVKISENQILAVQGEADKGFLKVSFLSSGDGKLYRDRFIQSGSSSLSYKPEDVEAALMLLKIQEEKDSDMRDVYFENAIGFPSYLSDRWGDYYYGDRAEESADDTAETAE